MGASSADKAALEGADLATEVAATAREALAATLAEQETPGEAMGEPRDVPEATPGAAEVKAEDKALVEHLAEEYSEAEPRPWPEASAGDVPNANAEYAEVCL